MLVNVKDVSIKFIDKVILDKVNLVINENDKIALVGSNGVGKSTFLKAIVDSSIIDSGDISYQKDLKIGYLPQYEKFDDNDTIINTINKQTNIEQFEAKTILSKLGLNDYNRLIAGLSGGEKKRLSLAIALSKKVNLLILDEPTNHLDVWMIAWLEKYLIKYNHALLLVTHDRYFLEHVTKKILELDKGRLYLYDGSYSFFLTAKAERLESMASSMRKMQAIYKKEAAWAALNPQARSTKSRKRLEEFDKLHDKLANNAELLKNNEQFKFNSIKSRMGKTTIEINHISKSINGKLLFNDFSYNVLRDDRIGIIGKNGSGKTTLFKSILGLTNVDEGSIVIGETIRVGYFKQENTIFDENIKVIDYIKNFGEFIETTDGTISAKTLLEMYMFPPNMQYMEINKLSGGEKRRLQLLSVLITNPNILFLDEPTNDLDIYTLDILEDFLESFKGAVIVISHDRYFLDKVVNHLFVFENGNINSYNGIVSDYIENEPQQVDKKETIKTISIVPRFTSQEKKEYDSILGKLEELENKINDTKYELSITITDYEKIIKLNNILDELYKKQEELTNRWMYLEDINDKIIKYRKEKYEGEKK